MSNPIFDISDLIESCDNDFELLEELINEFTASLPQKFISMNKALKIKDSKILEIETHTLKGLCATFGSKDLSEMASNLENEFRSNGVPDNIEMEFKKFEDQIILFSIQLQEFIQKKKAG